MKRLLILLVGVCISSHLMGQSLSTNLGNTLKLADKHYKSYSFKRAAELYELALQNNNDDPSIKLKLAESYRQLNEPDQAAQWYGSVIDNKQIIKPLHMLYYAQSLSSVGEYDEAKVWYKNYQDVATDDDRASKKIAGIEQLDQYFAFQDMYKVEAVAINSSEADFSPTFYDQGIVFASARGEEAWRKNTFGWNDKSFLDLYYSRETASGDLLEPQLFSDQLNSKLHEGPAVFFDNERKVIFTRNNYQSGKISKSHDKLVKLKLFYAEWSEERNGWSRVKELPFNSDDYSVGHPAISADGTALYFASDMPGGFGGTDLYRSSFVNGTWNTPVNLGSTVNTKGNEMFPFLHHDKVIYFASNGHGGLGGLDIYQSTLATSETTPPVNLGAPINSSKDDFSLIVEVSNRFGYFSSNRNGAMADDDIFRFVVNKIPMEVLLVDKQSGASVDTQEIKIIDSATGEDIAYTQENGKITFLGNPGKEYQVLAGGVQSGETVLISAQEIPADLGKKQIQVPLAMITSDRSPIALEGLEKADVIIVESNSRPQSFIGVSGDLLEQENPDQLYATLKEKGVTVEREIMIRDIYYNFDRFNIREDARPELDHILEVLQAYPKVKIQLSSHTDARGSEAYNHLLAQKRATAAVQYLLEKGISADRIVATSLGENELLNQCTDGSPCSTEQHQSNRRTEFYLIISE